MNAMEAMDACFAILPKVSCILCAGYGDRFVGMAVECFLNQDYQGELELVLVDNNDEPLDVSYLRDSLGSGFVYVRSKRLPVGALRNLGTQHTTGEICVTWDEDDWYAPDRVSAQVKRLADTGADVTGWHNVLYWDEANGRAFKYLYSPGYNHPPYAIGMSQCYRKDWWEKHPFPDAGIEDLPFSKEAMHARRLDSCDAGKLCVARIHDRNVCNKRSNHLGTHKQWPEMERTALPEEFLIAIGEKEAASSIPQEAEQEQ